LTRQEKLAEAFARGLMQGLIGAKGNGDDEPAKPTVVKQDDVRKAVADFLQPLIAEETEAPSSAQLDMFTHGMEDAPPDEMGERIAMRVAEARARAGTEDDEPPAGTFYPDMPQAPPWVGPPQ
jgi:hypothetical protein